MITPEQVGVRVIVITQSRTTLAVRHRLASHQGV
jgi:hypothetical protein